MRSEDFGFPTNDGRPIEDYYVYGWANADWGGTYFYVGKGCGDRYKNTANRGKAFKAICRNWRCFPVILVDGLSEEEAERYEVEIKERLIFEKGYPIMDGEGHSKSLKHLAAHYAKRKKKESNPNWREGRKAKEIPESFEEYKKRVAAGEITAKAACIELGISRSTWYKWVREIVV